MTPYYDEDGITIYHKDCREVLPTLENCDLVLTDPPYGLSLATEYEDRYGKELLLGARRINHPPLTGDSTPFDPAHLLGFGRCVLFGANYYMDRLPVGGWLFWDKVCSNDVRRLSKYWSDGELAWSNVFKGVKAYRHAWNGFSRSSENSFHVHPTQKPVSLMKWILGQWSEPDDLILDPYMGSGPIAQACHEMGRRYIGIEIEERYCQIAVGRLAQGVLEFR